jgi:WD40 repeat protein
MTCSTDRGIIIWNTNAEKQLMPQLVIIKELKSNLDAQWNHRGDKLCVGASSGHVYIGALNKDVGFWVAPAQTDKPLHKASVVAVRFDPGSGHVVASASADGSVIITSCYDENIDKNSKAVGPFAGVTSDTDEIFKFTNDAWVNTVEFSPSG